MGQGGRWEWSTGSGPGAWRKGGLAKGPRDLKASPRGLKAWLRLGTLAQGFGGLAQGPERQSPGRGGGYGKTYNTLLLPTGHRPSCPLPHKRDQHTVAIHHGFGYMVLGVESCINILGTQKPRLKKLWGSERE